jgi:hypothetical protein
MLTVRFDTGFSIQYNTAAKITVEAGHYYLRNTEGFVVAVAPLTAVVEYVQPCRTYNAGQKSDEQLRQFLDFIREHPSLSWSASDTLRDIKRELQRFDAVRKHWKS